MKQRGLEEVDLLQEEIKFLNIQLNQSIEREIELRSKVSEIEFKEEIKEYQTSEQIEIMLL